MAKPKKWQTEASEAHDDVRELIGTVRGLGWTVQHLVEVDLQLKLDHDKFTESGEYEVVGSQLRVWRSEVRSALTDLDEVVVQLRRAIASTKLVLKA